MSGKYLLAILFSLSIWHLSGQSTNINCATVLEIPDVTNYCSGETEFDNEDVGESEFEEPDCWSAAQNDLWFTFIASAKSINIIANASQGTMKDPEIALLKGEDCTFLTEVNCITNTGSDDIVTLFESNLIIGERYYIRIDGESNGDDGTFQLCISSYNPPVVPGQDCVTASLLCSKDPFVVQSIEGGGNEENEADGTCLDVGGSSENNSTWFKWTCAVSGTFTFDLIPLVITDDYDFAIFELPNGIDDCEKDLIRCGATDGGDFEPCGPNTGLDLTSVDLEEDENCDPGEDGYLRFIDMEAGKSYAMLINNFSDSDAGFSLEFGGTAEFEGPTADFEIGFTTCGSSIEVTDASLMGVSTITEYEWEFGSDASPSTETGPGPFVIDYASFGPKSITLKVVSDLGCQVFVTKEFDLIACSYLDSLEIQLDSILHIGCGGSMEGFIGVATNIDCASYEYNIDGGSFQSSPEFPNLTAGDHVIGIRDENGCEKDTIFTITQVADFTVDVGDDVTITDVNTGVDLNASTTATGDVTVSWSPNTGVSCTDGTDNCLNPNIITTTEQTYTITVMDENGCVSTDEITVFVDLCSSSDYVLNPGNDITLDFPGDTVNPPVGTIGTNDLTISWTPSEPVFCTDGSTNCMNPLIVVNETTTFTIIVIDEFGCEMSDMLTIVVPDVCTVTDLAISIDSIRGDYCDGAFGSYLEVSGLNGMPGFEYRLNDGTFTDDSIFVDLAPGVYSIDVRDAFNCITSTTVTIPVIPGFTVNAGEDLTIDGLEPFEMLNGSHDALSDVTLNWNPPLGLSCQDGSVNCLNPTANPGVSTLYTLTVTDVDGCNATDQVSVFVEERDGIFPPNIFSPNDDGFNDFFSIIGDPLIVESIEELSIFDRWGNLVYIGRDLSPSNPNGGWDGKVNGAKAASGVYVWYAVIKLLNPLDNNTDCPTCETKTVSGDLTLIR